MSGKPELLAPAGEPASAYAALHYGADAVYLGLKRFSARAEAVNFSPAELGELVGFAHSLQPARRVYLTLNTLVKENELPAAARTLLTAAEQGVDAVIVQDLGVAELVRKHCPGVKLHASTQMAIHNLAGAKAAHDLGYDRVTLARELTLCEVEAIAEQAGLEVEVFIHGALCYSYSGLCLCSSLRNGRSGNRGRCAYPCREAVYSDVAGGTTHPFSLKDMALGPKVLDLAAAGVRSLKIEGRKKSPLYVAATVDYYRRILDGKLDPQDREAAEARLKTIFARPWTDLFINGTFNPDVADLEVVGHRGAPLGNVEQVVQGKHGTEIQFTAKLPLELHDGIQTDLDRNDRPYGFPVNDLRLLAKNTGQKVFVAPTGSRVAVTLHADAPSFRAGLPLYLASSQEVKRSFPYSIPKSGLYSPRQKVDINIRVFPALPNARVAVEAVTQLPLAYAGIETRESGECGAQVAIVVEEIYEAYPARDANGPAQAAEKAFSRLGGSEFVLGEFTYANPEMLYVKPGDLNALRRRMTSLLLEEMEKRKQSAVTMVEESLRGTPQAFSATGKANWGICCDDSNCLAAFEPNDFADCAEISIAIGGRNMNDELAALESLAERTGREKIRLYHPLIMRKEKLLQKATKFFVGAGWNKWLIRSLAGWKMLREEKEVDMTADWSLYALNHVTVDQLRTMGISAVTFSPEDDFANYSRLAGKLTGETKNRSWIVVYADLPLFVSASCVHAQLGLCHTGIGLDETKVCGKNPLKLESAGGKTFQVLPISCGSVTIGDQPYSLAGNVDDLINIGMQNFRIDYCWRKYAPEEARSIWQDIRSGSLKNIQAGNFSRGLS